MKNYKKKKKETTLNESLCNYAFMTNVVIQLQLIS